MPNPDVHALPPPAPGSAPVPPEPPAPRRRPKPGERRGQILQALATLLEQPGGERITTAALAAHLSVSEAALYRQFASKAQMFEGLIDFIESTVFSLMRQLQEQAPTAPQCAQRQVAMLLQFAEKNPGLARVMVGDALVLENERLQQRMNRFFDKFEAALRQTLRDAHLTDEPPSPSAAPGQPSAQTPMQTQVQAQAAVLTAYCLGQLHGYVRSGFRQSPSAQWTRHRDCLFSSL